MQIFVNVVNNYQRPSVKPQFTCAVKSQQILLHTEHLLCKERPLHYLYTHTQTCEKVCLVFSNNGSWIHYFQSVQYMSLSIKPVREKREVSVDMGCAICLSLSLYLPHPFSVSGAQTWIMV